VSHRHQLHKVITAKEAAAGDALIVHSSCVKLMNILQSQLPQTDRASAVSIRATNTLVMVVGVVDLFSL